MTALEGREELGHAVRTLRVGDQTGGRTVAAGPWKLGRLFELCPSVAKLHLDHLEGITVEDIAKAQGALLSFSITSLRLLIDCSPGHQP